MKYAVYIYGEYKRDRDFDTLPDLPHKPYIQFYTIERVKPDYDPETQVIEGPTIEEDHTNKVRRFVWTVRDKTAQELNNEKTRIIDGLDRVLLKIAFNHENRVRALEGKQAITIEQFKAAVKGML